METWKTLTKDNITIPKSSETHYSLKEVILMHINKVKEDAMFIECLSTVGIGMFVEFL